MSRGSPANVFSDIREQRVRERGIKLLAGLCPYFYVRMFFRSGCRKFGKAIDKVFKTMLYYFK